MVCKLAFAALALLCVAQVMASPVVHTKPELVKPAKFNKGFFEDILIAVESVEALANSASALSDQIQSSLNVLTVDLVAQIADIIAKLGSFGVSQEDLDALAALVDTAVANVEAIINGILTDIQSVLDLLAQVGDDIFNNPFALIKHVQDLIAAIGKLETDVGGAFGAIMNEAINLENSILALVEGLVEEAVTEITTAIEGIYNTLVGEYNAVTSALNAVVAAAETAIAAIQKVISNLGRRH